MVGRIQQRAVQFSAVLFQLRFCGVLLCCPFKQTVDITTLFTSSLTLAAIIFMVSIVDTCPICTDCRHHPARVPSIDRIETVCFLCDAARCITLQRLYAAGQQFPLYIFEPRYMCMFESLMGDSSSGSDSELQDGLFGLVCTRPAGT